MTAGVTQSVNRALRLLRALPEFEQAPPERSRHTARVVVRRQPARSSERWNRGISESIRELREAIDELAKSNGARVYERLAPAVRVNLWDALILLATKRNQRSRAELMLTRAVTALRAIPQRVETDFQRAIGRQPTSSPQFRPAPPGSAHEVEYRARLSGDPRPDLVSNEEFRLYTQVMEAAIRQSNRYARSEEAQNPRLTLLMNLISAATGLAPGPVPSGGDASSPEAAIRFAVNSVGSDIMGRVPGVSGPLAAISIGSAVDDAFQQYDAATDSSQRLEYFARQEILRRAGGDGGRARQLLNRLQRTERLLDAQLQWFDRHRDHPAAGPAVPTISSSSR